MTDESLIHHLIAQTQANISLIQAKGYLNASDAADIQTKLGTASASRGKAHSGADGIAALTRKLGISSPPPPPTPGYQHTPPPHQQHQQPYQPPFQPPYSVSPPTSQYQPPMGPPIPSYQQSPPPPPEHTHNILRARALWAYNEDGKDPNDLMFSAGDVIEVVNEVNADWWEGRNRGRQGLFPSNYVEKLSPGSVQESAREYKPFMAAHHGADAPPPAQLGMTNSVGLQEADGQEKKKSKFGKYGNTMAHSAAGGLGFGAGAAIGGGIISSIF